LTFFTLMVGAPESSALAPRGSTVNIFCVDDGRSRIFGTALFCVDSGHSRISNNASHGACRRRCLPSTCFTLMVGAPGSPALPPRGPIVDVFYVDDGRSQISDTASQGPTIDVFKIGGGRCRISNNASQGAPSTSLRQVVDAPRTPAPPPRGSAIDVFKIGGGRSQISSITSQGGTIDVFKIGCECSRSYGTASQGGRHRRLQDSWWPLLDLRHHLPGGPLLTF
jgi:hypothetical protein